MVRTSLRCSLVLLLFAAAATAQPRVPRQVLAFYYGWYGNPQTSQRWVHWSSVDENRKTIGSSTHFPALRAYDSHSLQTVNQHCRWAKEAGLTGFVVSWWAPGDFHDQGLPMLLEAAQRQGLKITVYFETLNPPKGAAEDALKDVLYLLQHYGKHPAWLRVNAKPVVFVYGRAINQLKLEGWQQVIQRANESYPGGALFVGDQITARTAEVFDGIHAYNPTGRTAGKSVEELRAWARQAYPQWVKTAGRRIACVTVIPGYDDSKLDRTAPRPITDRHNGETYRVLWEEAVAAQPDWVLITSWNEWHEGSEIEPSEENGQRELKTTRTFAKSFLKK